MEEKERYKLESPNGTSSHIHDTELDEWFLDKQSIAELLNKQDKCIKELKNSEDNFCECVLRLQKENKQIQKQLEIHNEYFNSFNCNSFDEFTDFISTFMLAPHEEQTLINGLKKQLKQSQKQLAIGELEKLHEIFRNTVSDLGMCKFICTVVENQIEELKKHR